MYKKIVWQKTLIFPNFEDLKLVVRDPNFSSDSQEKISSQQAEILTAVYGIIYSNVSTKKTSTALKKFFAKYISSERWNMFSQMNTEIEKRQFWKIMERVIIEYFLNSQMGVTSYASQDITEWIDFIFKIGNIKIGTDITIIQNKKSIEIKKQKIENQSYLVDYPLESNKSEVWIWRQVDAVSLAHFYLPNKLQQYIFEWIQKWQENNYNWHWSNYISQEEKEKIDHHFHDVLWFLQSFFQKIFVKQKIWNMAFSDGFFQLYATFNKISQTIEFIIQENGETVFEFYLPFTQSLYEKLHQNEIVTREYNPKVRKLTAHNLSKPLEEKEENQDDWQTSREPSSKIYRRRHMKNILWLDSILEDIQQYSLLSTKDKNKIQRL